LEKSGRSKDFTGRIDIVDAANLLYCRYKENNSLYVIYLTNKTSHIQTVSCKEASCCMWSREQERTTYISLWGWRPVEDISYREKREIISQVAVGAIL
jgi:hypothetical protein